MEESSSIGTTTTMTMTKKQNIAIFNVSESGHLNLGLGLARKLVDAGHQVSHVTSSVASDAATIQRAVQCIEAAGAAYLNHYELPGINSEEAIKLLASLPLSPFIRSTACTMAVGTQATIDWLKSSGVDLVVFGHYVPAAYVAAKVLGLPMVCIFTQIPFQKQGYWSLAWMDMPAVSQALSKVNDEWGIDMRQVLHSDRNMWYKGVKTIAYTLPELSDLNNPEECTLVGCNLRKAIHTDHPLVQQVLVWKSKSDSNNKAMLVCLGSLIQDALFGLFQDFLKQSFWPAIRFLASSRPELMIVLGVGGPGLVAYKELYDDAEGAALPNLLICDYVPQLEILPHVDVALHHGGCNSLHECLQARVPMILLPTNGDGLENANIVIEKWGCGVHFPNENKFVPGRPFPLSERACFTPQSLEAAVLKCIATDVEGDKIRSNVVKLADRLEEMEKQHADVHAVLGVV